MYISEENDKVKEGIILAAQDLFKRYGFHKTSVNEIAKKAKIAKATIYKYFESKDMLLQYLLLDHIGNSVNNMLQHSVHKDNLELYLGELIFKTCRITYVICNELIGWDFIRESANSQGFLKKLSDDLESLLIASFLETPAIKRRNPSTEGLRFLIRSSKSIVFSYAFTSVTDADVRRNFIMFHKEILPYLTKASVL